MRKKVVAGNWKMHKTLAESLALVKEISQGLKDLKSTAEVIVAPTYPNLSSVVGILDENGRIKVAAQNCHHEEQGAFTGEVSAAMLKEVGVEYVILGHSERRQYFHEHDELILSKTRKALEHGLKPIFCCGELLKERESGDHFETVKSQLDKSIFQLSEDEFSRLIIAYEPVWAIGTGLTASPAQAQEMHHAIRSWITGQYDQKTADNMRILYGGSCKPGNAAELFAQADIDGGLIGGAALKAADFLGIISAA